MKICIIGENSKVGKLIESSNISNNNTVIKYSQRSQNEFEEIKNYETIIYLVSDTRTVIKLQEYVKYIYSNCFLLSKFIIENNENLENKKFIYLSSAKIYNIFIDKTKYSENDILQDIPEYKELLSIAKKIIDIARKNNSKQDIIKEIEKNILKQFLNLHKIDKYYPIYEYCKAISEIIINILLDKAYILRPTYLYGQEDEENIIYNIVKNAFNGQKIELTTAQKDFVTYKTFIKVINDILNTDNHKIITINISNSKNINNKEILYYIRAIEEIISKKAIVKSISKCSKEYIVDNTLMKRYLNNEYVQEDFSEEIRKIIYKYYIQRIEKLDIISEYNGGSYAKVYLVKDNTSKFILKMSIGNGASNGNVKLRNETLQIQKVKNVLDKENIVCLPQIYDMKIFKNSTIIKEEFIEGKTISDCIYQNNSNEDIIEHQIKNMCELFLSIYTKNTINHSINMLKSGIDRAKIRLLNVKNVNYSLNYFQNVLTFDHIMINNQQYENPIRLLEKIYETHKEKFENKLGLCLSRRYYFR